jgi:hypothetical protein
MIIGCARGNPSDPLKKQSGYSCCHRLLNSNDGISLADTIAKEVDKILSYFVFKLFKNEVNE